MSNSNGLNDNLNAKIKSKMNFIERFYWEDSEELNNHLEELCKDKHKIFEQCVQEKSYNRCVVPERRDYQRCLLDEKLKLQANDHNLFQRLILKAEVFRGNTGDIPSDYIEQRFKEEEQYKQEEEQDDEEDDE
ncbi:hypothetical protein ABK040_012115 [Willaertia magna]